MMRPNVSNSGLTSPEGAGSAGGLLPCECCWPEPVTHSRSSNMACATIRNPRCQVLVIRLDDETNGSRCGLSRWVRGTVVLLPRIWRLLIFFAVLYLLPKRTESL